MLHRLVFLLLLLICYPVYSTDIPGSLPGTPLVDIRNNGGVALNLGDDSVSGNIPLGFDFRLFGRTFNSVWVSNNGVVSFSNGDISGYNSRPLRQLGSEYNYALLPLWTDLINDIEQNPWVSLRPNSAIFGWYNTSEYSNRSSKSSFEVQLWNNNNFEFRYSNVNLSRQPFTIGYTGNISANEYVQWARSPGGIFTGENFKFSSDPTSQCNVNPLYNVDCPGYAAAYLQQQCSINQLFSTSCPRYEQTLLEQNCASNALYSSQCPGYAAALLEQNCARNPLYSSQCSGYTAALNKQISKNTTAVSVTDSKLGQQALEDTTKTTTTVDVGGVELSIQGTISIATGIPEVIKNVDTRTSSSTANNQTIVDRSRAISRIALETARSVLLAEAATVNSVLDSSVTSSIDTSQLEKSLGGVAFSIAIPEENKSSPTRSLALAQASVNSSTSVSSTSLEQTAEKTLNTTSQISDLGEGASFSGLSRPPAGFSAYTATQLRDAQFYAPREIYRGQVNVDNARAGRLLNGASDRLHRDMVDQQYRR